MTPNESCAMTLIPLSSVESKVDLSALVEAHSATLFRVAHSILRSPEDAKDVVQDVFVRVLKHRSKLSHVSDVRVWLIRIAWNLALDRKKRKKLEQLDTHFADTLVSKEVSADRAIDQAQRLRAVLQEIEQLPKAERQALLLSTVKELGTADLGLVLGRSEAAVRGLIHRARTRLQKDLEGKL